MGYEPRPLILDGAQLTVRDLMDIGENRVSLDISLAGRERVKAARDVFERSVETGCRIYGSNTGVGAMKDVIWSKEETGEFHSGLAYAHHFGIGEALPPAVVRAALALRINTALTGHSCCSIELVEALLDLLRAGITPVVRREGSIGCADIGLMGQVASTLTGIGQAHYRNSEIPMEEALRLAGLPAFRFRPGDALASFSLNAIGYSTAVFAVHDAASVVRRLLITSLCSAAALGASPTPWQSAAATGIAPHARVGRWLREATRDWTWPRSANVHDPLSLRMIPQILGSTLQSLDMAAQALVEATSVADDNPVVAEDMVLTSGGSLPIEAALAMQSAQVAVTHAARNSFNRCALLVNGGHGGLPVNLVPPGSIATGFGPALKLAADLYTRVAAQSTAISPQALVAANGMEDEATHLPLIVERFEAQVAALGHLAALEAMFAAEAIDIKAIPPQGVATLIYDTVRKHADRRLRDRPLSDELQSIARDMSSAAFSERLSHAVPLAEWDRTFALETDPSDAPPPAHDPHRPAAGTTMDTGYV